MFMALATSLVVLFYCCATADILTKLLQQCFLIFIVVPWLYLGNSQVSVYRTIGPPLVLNGNFNDQSWVPNTYDLIEIFVKVSCCVTN